MNDAMTNRNESAMTMVAMKRFAGKRFEMKACGVTRWKVGVAISGIVLVAVLAGQASAQSRVRLEVSRAYYQHLAAAQSVAVTQAALAQAEESLRIIHNRYEAGLATVTDVLRAEDAERQSQTSYWQSVYENTISFAALRLATGTLNADQVGSFQ